MTLIAVLLVTACASGPEWKKYPYQPTGSKVRFHDDEGAHKEAKTEWWYANYHLTGKDSGKKYGAMVAYFNNDFRLFSITDETEGKYYPMFANGTLGSSSGKLELSYDSSEGRDSWVNAKDWLGNFKPFEYSFQIKGQNASLQLDLVAEKPPLLVGGTGLISFGSMGESYDYSLTRLKAIGELAIADKEEKVEGLGWIDRQWGPFEVGKTPYEWFSVQLDNDWEFNLAQVFEDGDKAVTLETVMKPDGSQNFTQDFKLQATNFWRDSREIYWAHGWRFVDEAQKVDLEISPTVDNQLFLNPQKPEDSLWEGSCHVSGTIAGNKVEGVAYAEIFHSYKERPET